MLVPYTGGEAEDFLWQNHRFPQGCLYYHCFRVLGILELGCYLSISLHEISRSGHIEDLSFMKYPVKYIGVQIF